MFRVTTLPIDNPDKIPLLQDNQSSSPIPQHNPNSKKTTDFSKDFFKKPTFLTVSGQVVSLIANSIKLY